MKRIAIVFIALLFAGSLITFTGCTSFGNASKTSSTDTNHSAAAQKEFTLDELKLYDGQNGNPAYIAVDGVVYDVTNDKQWSGGTHQGYSAGQDLTDAIGKAPHGKTELDGVPIVGTLIG